MRYYLAYRQADEGCDYTIGCGMVYTDLYVDNLEEAIEQAVERVRVGGLNSGRIADMLIFTDPTVIDVASLHRQMALDMDADFTKQAVEREKKDLARLLKKYPQGGLESGASG